MDPIELSIFACKINAVCEEMGAQLQLSAFSPNIKDRLDYSCAVFDSKGGLCAQAAHIPVHLGSMAFAMKDIIEKISWKEGDILILNDPYLGGTHLPDVTIISPVFIRNNLLAFVVSRAHHADIGAETPGSMPISNSLDQEGIIIPPTKIGSHGEIDQQKIKQLFMQTLNLRDTVGDIIAQCSANNLGIKRIKEIIDFIGAMEFVSLLHEINEYGQRIAQNVISRIPNGEYLFTDYMEDDGQGNIDIPIHVLIKVNDDSINLDFSNTASQVVGNINCPISVTAAAVYYVFRCLMPAETPACAGSFLPIEIKAPTGSLLNAKRPAAVAAGNVETSSRVVDVVLGALSQALPNKIPACSQGTMNNLAMGSTSVPSWGYYETIAGGMGASSDFIGLSAVQSHMTNTRNTPIEVLEFNYPLIVKRYGIRNNSGGAGLHRGGEGVVREFEFLDKAIVTILSERRQHEPWGLQGGEAGKAGANYLNKKLLPAKVKLSVKPGDCLCLETPGGGGWGNYH